MLLLVILWCQGRWQTDRVFMNHSLQMALLVFRQLWAQVAWGLNRGFLPGRTPWELAAFISLVPISPWQEHYFTKPTFNKLYSPGKNLEIFNTQRIPASQFNFYSFPEDARHYLEQPWFVCMRICFPPPQLKRKYKIEWSLQPGISHPAFKMTLSLLRTVYGLVPWSSQVALPNDIFVIQLGNNLTWLHLELMSCKTSGLNSFTWSLQWATSKCNEGCGHNCQQICKFVSLVMRIMDFILMSLFIRMPGGLGPFGGNKLQTLPMHFKTHQCHIKGKKKCFLSLQCTAVFT